MKRGSQLPGGAWRGRQWGAGGPPLAPRCTLATCHSGWDPHCVLSLPSQAVGTAACTHVPAVMCGLQASWPCSQLGPGCTQAFLCLRPRCPPRVPEALPGPKPEGRFPLDSKLVTAAPSPTSGRDPKALSPGSAGPVGRVSAGRCPVPGSCWLGVGGAVRASQDPDGQMRTSPWGWAPPGRLPALGTPQG